MKHMSPKFYGISTVGERGQIVIPSEARENMNIKPGQKLIFFGGGSIIHMIDASQFDSVFTKMHKDISTKIAKIKREVEEAL